MTLNEWQVKVILELQDLYNADKFLDDSGNVRGFTIPDLVSIIVGLNGKGGIISAPLLRKFLYVLRDLTVLESCGTINKNGVCTIYFFNYGKSLDFLYSKFENSSFYEMFYRLYHLPLVRKKWSVRELKP